MQPEIERRIAAIVLGIAAAGCAVPAVAAGDGGVDDADIAVLDAPSDGGVDSGDRRDAGAMDAGDDGGAIDSGEAGAPIDACGSCDPDAGALSDAAFTIQLANGLIIARDGTMYFTQPGGVGRVLPDRTTDAHWAPISGTSTLTGLALDASNGTLFVGVLNPTGSIYRVDTATRAASLLVTTPFPYRLTIGPDGSLYFADDSAGAVFRVDPSTGVQTQVTTTPVPSARAVAFEAGGTLLVTSAGVPMRMFRLTLAADGTESSRAIVGTFPQDPNDIAIDAIGRIYYTSEFGQIIIRTNADGTGMVTLVSGLSAPAGMDFGHGALGTSDLFYVSGGTPLRYANDTAGAAVPWH